MNVVYLCLGGNMGDREVAFSLAITKINLSAGKVILTSPVYETEAWGVTNQQAYLNCCICIETELSSSKLLTCLLDIEKELGRSRTITETYEPRRIDIDILFYNEDIIKEEYLIVPHPRLHLRRFVLVPLNDIAPHYLHPVLNKTIFNLLSNCEDTSAVTLFK